MNKRIKEFALQASIYQPERFDCIDGSNQLEKFAELIVKECSEISRDHQRNYYKSHGARIAEKIKDHFGVEL